MLSSSMKNHFPLFTLEISQMHLFWILKWLFEDCFGNLTTFSCNSFWDFPNELDIIQSRGWSFQSHFEHLKLHNNSNLKNEKWEIEKMRIELQNEIPSQTLHLTYEIHFCVILEITHNPKLQLYQLLYPSRPNTLWNVVEFLGPSSLVNKVMGSC